VKILPAEASVLVDVPDMQILLIDARRDLPAAKALTKLLTTTGVGAPVIAITTEGGLSAISAEWGIDDVMLDTAGPAEVDARIRLAIGTYLSLMNASDPSAGEIRTGEVVIDVNSYTARIKGRALDLVHSCCKKFGVMTISVELAQSMFTSVACVQSSVQSLKQSLEQ